MEQKIKQDEIFIGQNIRGVSEKQKEYGRHRYGYIDTITKCTDNQRSTSKNRKRDTAYTGIAASGNQERALGNNI